MRSAPTRSRFGARKATGFLKVALMLCQILIFTTLPSCQANQGEIVVIPRTTATTFSEAEHAGAEFAARELGLRIRWNGPTRDDDVESQIGLVDRAVQERCKGLILMPDEPMALMVPVERALAAGVPTVVVGSALSLPSQRNLSYIVNDDELTGRLAAMRIGDVLHAKGEVAIVGVDPQSLSSLAVLSSFVSVIEQQFPNISVVDRRSTASNNFDSELVVDQVLLSHPKVDAIFALNSTGTIGAYFAVKAHSLTHRIKVVGVQQSAALAEAIRLHQIDSIIAEDTYQMGSRAVESLAPGQTKTPGTVKLAPMLITADNVDSASARPFIMIDWRSDH